MVRRQSESVCRADRAVGVCTVFTGPKPGAHAFARPPVPSETRDDATSRGRTMHVAGNESDAKKLQSDHLPWREVERGRPMDVTP